MTTSCLLLLTILSRAEAKFPEFFTPLDSSLGVGQYYQFIGEVQIDQFGNLNNQRTLNPYAVIGLQLPISKRFAFYPEAGLVMPKETRDKSISKLHYFVRTDLGFRYLNFVLHAGMGLFMTRIGSNGGSKRLNNGIGYDDFPLPDEHRTSQNVTWDLGLEIFLPWILEDISIKGEGHVFNPTAKENRFVNYTLSISYHFGDIFKKAKKQEQKNR